MIPLPHSTGPSYFSCTIFNACVHYLSSKRTGYRDTLLTGRTRLRRAVDGRHRDGRERRAKPRIPPRGSTSWLTWATTISPAPQLSALHLSSPSSPDILPKMLASRTLSGSARIVTKGPQVCRMSCGLAHGSNCAAGLPSLRFRRANRRLRWSEGRKRESSYAHCT